MSLPAVLVGLTDTVKGVAAESLDAEAVRVLVLGVKQVRAASTTLTVTAGQTASNRATAYSDTTRLFVIKTVVASADCDVHIVVDGIESVVSAKANTPVDVELLYGYRLYGNTVDVYVTVSTAPTTDTSITVTLYGAVTSGNIQHPA